MNAQQRELNESRKELASVNSLIKRLTDELKGLRAKKKELETKIESLDEIVNKSFVDKQTFPWDAEVKEKLKNVFHIKSFRGHQETVINCTLSGKDCIYVAATGSGKSLVFQLPALISSGITLVVSPLISLMEDQGAQMEKLGIPTIVLNSSTTREVARMAHTGMVDPNSNLKLIYVTPEKLAKSKYIMSQVQKMYELGRFSRLVIDEVHCCSEWGHDFRKDYKQLHIFKREFPTTPILGLTATATPTVIGDIRNILGIPRCLLFKGSFYRPNLYYDIRVTSNRDSVNDIVDFINTQHRNQSGIIYCLTIKETEDVATKLNNFGIPCLAYHAQLDTSVRNNIQKQWYNDGCRVIAATVAFGLGINKMDVRFVIHYTISKSLENYYQETGRAGRDGNPAHCVCYYRFADVFRATSITYSEKNGKAHVYDMLKFCLNRRTCRKKLIAAHFVDDLIKHPSDARCCDNCVANVERMAQHFVDASDWLNTLLEILQQAEMINEKMTSTKLIDAWLQVKGPKKLRLENISRPSLTRVECETIVALLLCDGYLEEYFHITPYNVISYIEIGQTSQLFKLGKAPGPKIHSNSFEFPPISNDLPSSTERDNHKDQPSVTNAIIECPSSSNRFSRHRESPEIIHIKSEDDHTTWDDYIYIE